MTEALQRIIVGVVTGAILAITASGSAMYYSTKVHEVELKTVEKRLTNCERKQEALINDLYSLKWSK